MEEKAYVSKITHGSLEDGKGIRTVVFFGGCDLNCRWCHNPECIPHKPVLMYFKNKCIGCGRCIEVCPKVFEKEGNNITVERNFCNTCGKCVNSCLGEALEMSVKKMNVEEVFREIYADISYYKYSEGGVTFSGGECLRQHSFLTALLKKCREANINTCVESCLDVSWEVLEGVAEYVDSFFVDIKHMDPIKHKKYTGVSNERILENIRRLSEKHSDIIFRIPLIPGVNDDNENLTETVKFVASLNNSLVKRIQLLKYNNFAKSKYESIDRRFVDFGTPQSPELMAERVDFMNKICAEVNVF